MKISVALSPDPFRSSSHGPPPLGHLCRHFFSMGSAAVESLDSPREPPQLWWNRLGPDFSIDSFPPDTHLFFSNKAKLSDAMQEGENYFKPMQEVENCIKPIQEVENCIKPPLAYYSPSEQNQQKHLLAQVNPRSLQTQNLDHTEILQEHLIHRNGNMVLEESIDHSRLPEDADFPSSDGESHPQSAILMSECHCESNHFSEEAPETPASARVKLMCSFGGRIIPRPVDGKLRYVGGETRIIAVHKHISFAEFMFKMAQFYGAPLGLKYQLPDEDLDALVSVSSDDDLQNMMEEYDKVGSSGSASRLRLFFFSTPTEVEVSEMKLEGEDGCPSPDQRYVDAINGVSGKLLNHVNLLEDDTGGLRQVDGGNIVEGNGRMPPFEHANEMSQSKGPSAPSSSPSSPSFASRQASYHKPPGLVDFSLQNLNDKVTMAPHGFEGDVEFEGSGSSSSTPFHHQNDHLQYDQQFSLAADSPRVLHHDLMNSRGGENWPGLRHVDSQSKLARQSEQHAEYRTNGAGASDHWHEISHSRDTVLPQGEHQRIIQQHKHSIPLQQYHHQQQQHYPQQLPYHHHQQQPIQQQQQGWYPQIDGDSGRTEQSHQDMHKQPQVVHLHHQPPHHLHHNASMHDQCSWNAEYHARGVEHNAAPPFIHASTQINPQILHGLAPAPPYQMGSAPSSPKVGVYDFQGKCSCGLQHSQVHRGITVSIGEQPNNRWPSHYGDQAVRKQGFRNSSRFYDNASYAADSSMWQHASHSMVTGEAEHREHAGSHWQQHYLGRHLRDFHVTECQTRSRAMQYCETLVHDGDFLPTPERPEMNKRCLCINCLDNKRQPVEMMIGHSAYSEVPDHLPEWLLHRKGFDLDGSRVSAARKPVTRVPVYKEENERGDFVDDRFIEGESGLCVSQLPGDSESRRTMTSYVDGMHHGRKPAIPLGALPNKFPVSDEPLVSQPSVQGPSDWHPLAKTSVEVPGNWADMLLSQQGQNSNRLMEASNISSGREVTRMSLASSASVMLEEVDNSTQAALFSDVQHHNYGASTSHSFYREENDMPGNVGTAAGVALVHCSAASGIENVDLGSNGPKIPTAHGDMHLLSPDVIPLGHISSTSVAPDSGQAVPSASIMSNMEQTTASPIYDHSPFSSVNMTNFSFAAGQSKLPLPEENTDKKPFASCMSATEILADDMVSSVLECSSNEELSGEITGADQEVAYTDSQKVLQDLAITNEGESSNTLKLSVTEQANGLSFNDASIVNRGLEAITTEETRVIHMVQSDELNKTSYQEKDSEVGIPVMEDSKKPALSEAETEAIARGLQIIKNSDLEDLKELGSGTYGTVFHGKWRGSDVAIKRIKASCFTGLPSERERLMSDFWREACTLGQLHHPNVVAFYGVVPDGPGGTLATVTEYMVNGSLKQVLHKKDRTIDRRKRLFIAMDAAFGMEYLHSKNIVHFDLKCENLLVNMRDAHRPICKVGDFGLSKIKHQTLVSGGVRGTLPWMAPELLSGNCSMVSDKIDVFSFGIVMWELLTGEEPYASMHCGAIIGGIVNNTLRPSIPSWCDPGWRSLMERCWSGNPAERPAFAEVARELRAIAATMNLK